MLVQTIINSHI